MAGVGDIDAPRRGLDRRTFLRSLALGGGAAALVVLDACSRTTPLAADLPVGDAPASSSTGVLNFANWPYYIDRGPDGSHPSLERFTRETGTQVNYSRSIRDEDEFCERIRPALRRGVSPGFDLAVLSNGPELSEMIARSWLHPLDHDLLPNFQRFSSALVRNPVWDLGNQYTVAWQSGITGIAFRDEAVRALGRPPTSIKDLWDPALRGRVGMLRDLNDLGSFALLSIDVPPASSTPDDWEQAASHLRQQRPIVRGYYDQGYIGALRRGHVWATMAWSGDIFQLQLERPGTFRFVVPDEGGMFWTDNLFIPYTAEDPVDAMLFMNFVYRPTIAALIADAVRYTSPVPAARSIVATTLDDPVVARNPYVFPRWDVAAPGSTSGTSSGLQTEPSNLVAYYPFIGVEAIHLWRRTFGPIVTDR